MLTTGNLDKNIKKTFFYVLCSDKTWVFGQSRLEQALIYTIMWDMTRDSRCVEACL